MGPCMKLSGIYLGPKGISVTWALREIPPETHVSVLGPTGLALGSARELREPPGSSIRSIYLGLDAGFGL